METMFFKIVLWIFLQNFPLPNSSGSLTCSSFYLLCININVRPSAGTSTELIANVCMFFCLWYNNDIVSGLLFFQWRVMLSLPFVKSLSRSDFCAFINIYWLESKTTITKGMANVFWQAPGRWYWSSCHMSYLLYRLGRELEFSVRFTVSSLSAQQGSWYILTVAHRWMNQP